jgi:LmbE family N-acetylglucosaminyl deacetylase
VAAMSGTPGSSFGSSDLDLLWGPARPTSRAPRILGLFAHPDDEVFCFGGTIARCAQAGAVTGIATLTRGEAGQIRDAAVATRRSLGTIRVKELEQSAAALGVDQVTCLDLGDGNLPELPLDELAASARLLIDQFAPDVVVTFGPDGASGHPDHRTSSLATLAAVRMMPHPPRLLHAMFPVRGQLLADLIVEWLMSQPERDGTEAFGTALKLFAIGASMLGLTSDHIRVEWYPAGSYIVEQGEPATELFCILSGTADILVEAAGGAITRVDTTEAGCFFGEVGLATGRPRNAHVVARDAVTCLVFAQHAPSLSAPRGEAAVTAAPTGAEPPSDAPVDDCLVVDVRPVLDRKVAALAAHRSQYALEADDLPLSVLDRLLGSERFVVIDPER